MFKQHDEVLVIGTGERGTVNTVVLTGSGRGVYTSLGCYPEEELQQAHPTVIANANPPNTNKWQAEWEAKRAAMTEEEKAQILENLELRPKVEALLKEANLGEVDFRGHWKNGSMWPDSLKKELVTGVFYSGVLEDSRALVGALTTGVALDRWINLGYSSAMSSEGCSCCGQRPRGIESNGVAVRLRGKECQYPQGWPKNTWELNCPSGKLVVANDLREWFPLEGDDHIPSVNLEIGRRMTSSAYADVGMAHASVGNSCPSVYKLSDGKFKIANHYEDYDEEEEKRTKTFEGERVASICTDLWWYSIADLDECNRRIERFGGSLKDMGATVIDVRPGVYRFEHNDSIDRDGEEVVFSTFDWVREPDPVRDYVREYNSIDVNPHAYVRAQVKAWPTLYGAKKPKSKKDDLFETLDEDEPLSWEDFTGEQKTRSWGAVADHIFFTIGSGSNWSDKGFPSARVDPTIPDIEPPSFRECRWWYPFSEGYGGLFSPEIKMTPSFAKLAFRCLESIISFGLQVQDSNHYRDVKGARNRMSMAVARYRELAKEHPQSADPEYVAWLSIPGRAEAWVERFPLGASKLQKHIDYVNSQRWIPEGAYAVEFDVRESNKNLKLGQGHFAGPMGWAHRENATGYALLGTGDAFDTEHAGWFHNARDYAIPLYAVARVVNLGEVSHMGETIVEVAFDYGNAFMLDATKRKAIPERELKTALRVLTKDEYEALLPEAKKFFENPPKAKPEKKRAPKKVAAKKTVKKKVAAKKAPKRKK